MNTIANLWWLWLAGALITLLYGGYNQLARMRRMMNPHTVWDTGESSFFKGMVPFILAAVLNFAFAILLVVAIVLNIIDYAKH